MTSLNIISLPDDAGSTVPDIYDYYTDVPGYISTGYLVAAGVQSVGVDTVGLLDRTGEGLITVTAGMTVEGARGYFELAGGDIIDSLCLALPGEDEYGLNIVGGGNLVRCTVEAPNHGKGVFLRRGHVNIVECDLSQGEDAFYGTGGSAYIVRTLLKPSDTGINPNTGEQGHCDCIQLAPSYSNIDITANDGKNSVDWVYTFGCGLVLPDELAESQCVMLTVGSENGTNGGSNVYMSHGDHFQGGQVAVNTNTAVRGITDLAVVENPSMTAGTFLYRDFGDTRGPVFVPGAVRLSNTDGSTEAEAINWVQTSTTVTNPGAIRETTPPNNAYETAAAGAPRLWCNPDDGADAPVRWVWDERATPIYIPEPTRIVRPANSAELITALSSGTCQPGDHIYLQPGVVYTGDKDIEVNGNDVESRVVIRQEPGTEWWRDDGGDPATITGEGFDAAAASHIMILHCKIHDIDVSTNTGIGLHGKTSTNSGPNGGQSPGTDITVYGNWIRDTMGSAITVRGTKGQDNAGDYDNMNNVVIESNLVERAVRVKNECITVSSGVDNCHVRYNIVRDAPPDNSFGREGIDFKNGVSNSTIQGNIIYDLRQRCIYLDGGDFGDHPDATQYPVLENIDIFENYCIGGLNDGLLHGGTCLNISTEGKGNIDGVRVFNNIFKDTADQPSGAGYHGINVYKTIDSPNNPGGDQATVFRNIEIRHNTVMNAWSYGINMSHPGYDGTPIPGVVIQGNIVLNSGGAHDIFDVGGDASIKNIARRTDGINYVLPDGVELIQPGEETESTYIYQPTGDGNPAIDPSPSLDYRPTILATDFHGRDRGNNWDYGAVQS